MAKYLDETGLILLWSKIKTLLGSVYNVKGSCTSANLPTTKSKGDVWNLTDDSDYGPIGTNVVWDGNAWDPLGAVYGTFTTSKSGLVPSSGSNTTKYLKGDGTWDTPTDTVYDTFTTTKSGLVPSSGSNTTKYLKGDGTWDTPTDTVYSTFTSAKSGLVPSSGSNTDKFLKGDGTWGTPTDTNDKVKQEASSVETRKKLLFSYNGTSTASGTITSGATNVVQYCNTIEVQPSTGSLFATKLYANNTEVTPSNYVTLDSAQTITAQKTFSHTDASMVVKRTGTNKSQPCILYQSDTTSIGSIGVQLVGTAKRPYFWNTSTTYNLVTSTNSTAVGDANTPVYVNADGLVVSTGKSFGNYLPLAGGTMTGNINMPYGDSACVKGIVSTASTKAMMGFDGSGNVGLYGNAVYLRGGSQQNSSSGTGLVVCSTYTETQKNYLVINPDTNGSSYNEGIRLNVASNGYAVAHFGGANNTVSGCGSTDWTIGRRGSNTTATTWYAPTGSFMIAYGGSNSGKGATIDSAGNFVVSGNLCSQGRSMTLGGTYSPASVTTPGGCTQTYNTTTQCLEFTF